MKALIWQQPAGWRGQCGDLDAMLRAYSLRYFIFFWLALAIALPLVGLLLVTAGYSRHLYEVEVERDIHAALNRTVAAFDRRLFIERDLLGGLSRVAAVSGFLPVLEALAAGRLHPEYTERSAALAGFFETFQRVRRSLGMVRLLDLHGNTLVKVRDGASFPPLQETLDGHAAVDLASDDPVMSAALRELRRDDPGSLPLTPVFDRSNAVFSTVLPLRLRGQTLGYLSTEAPLGAFDRTLDVAPRPRGAALLVAEINPDDTARNGLILYSDLSSVSLTLPGERMLLGDRFPLFAAQAGYGDEGRLQEADGASLFYAHYQPYPDRLIDWVFALRIANADLAPPFRHTGWFVLLGMLLAVFIAMLLAYLGANRLARPICELSRMLSAFSRGDRGLHVQPVGPLELRQSADAFNRMVMALQQLEAERDQAQQAMLQSAKLASVGQLAAGIGHELSNPLGNIYSLTRLLQRHFPADEPAAADVLQIREEAERASRIIKDVLSFARQGPARASEFALVPWMADSLALVERLARERGVMIDWRKGVDCVIHADRGLLQQALVNILINALQASPKNTRVQVSSHCADGWLSLQVEDQGGGIPAESADRLFDPFYTTKPEGQGTGLGLSIAMGIVERHQGQLTLQTAPAGGALAIIRLPVQRSAE
jgi:two-component system NtrC family sensor kinase